MRRNVFPLLAALLALWSAIPFAVWWDGASAAQFAGAWATWGWGCVIAGLAVLLLLAITKNRAPAVMLGWWRRFMQWPSAVYVAVAAGVFALLSLAMCLLAFDGNPRNVDGFAQLFQARIFQAGRLWAPPPAELANFGTLQMVLGPDRWYSQYPYGQSLILAAGLAVGAWWLLNPLIAAALAVTTYHAARWIAGESTARLTLLLLCLSPFAVAMAGSEMSHLGAATLGMAAAVAAMGATSRRPLLNGLLAGLALGFMTAFRPLDAVAAAIAVALIIGAFAQDRVRALAGTFAGGVAAAIPTLVFNALTTGSWRRFGYEELWGPDHSLGFHPVPFGVPLTLARAIARSGMDLHQLNVYLLDTTIPVLLIVAAGYFAGRGLTGNRDAVPFAGLLALIAAMFTYWHRDVFYGPRFLFSAIGWLIILVARALVLLRRSSPSDSGIGVTAAFAVAVALAFGLVTITPGRIRAYRQSTPLFALHPDRDARAAGISNAVVVIPDGWGSRLIARMWQLGVPVRRSTRLYGAVDACTLERELLRAATDPAARANLVHTLDSLGSAGMAGRRRGATSDPNLRLPETDSLPEACRRQIDFDRRGFYSFAPYLHLNNASLDGDIVYARDLVDNDALRARYPGRRFYRYAPGEHGPLFIPLGTAAR